MVYTLCFFFSSKCSLFHNSNVFGSCVIHILYTWCAKIKKKILVQKVKSDQFTNKYALFVNKKWRETECKMLAKSKFT